MAVSKMQPYTLVELSCSSAASPLLLGGMINESEDEEKSVDGNLINTGNNSQLLRGDTMMAELDPAILEEFKVLDAKARKPNFD